MNRKPSMQVGLAPPTENNRRMSIVKGGLAVSNDSSRRASNVAQIQRNSVSTGPTLVGLLASKRLAKRLTTRFFDRRGGRHGSRLSAQIQIPVKKEPSYRMEPHMKFSPDKVEDIINEVLNEKLARFKYNPKFCANITKVLSDEIKDKVKLLKFDRYKIVVHITIGEKKDQNFVTCSRSIWDDHYDNHSTYTYQNKYIFCTGSVFGVYMD